MNAIKSGRAEVAEAGEPMQLWPEAMEAHDVDIVALNTNMSRVWIGDNNVRAEVGNETGMPLEPGHVYHLDRVDMSTIYIDSATAGEGVTWNVVNDV